MVKISVNDLVYEPPSGEVITEINGNKYTWKIRGFTTDELEEIASVHSVEYDRDPVTNKPIARLNYGILRRYIIFEGVIEPPAIILEQFKEWTLDVVKKLRSAIRSELWDGINDLSDDIDIFTKKSN